MVRTEELRVGDVVQLHDGEIIPADLVLLTTKDDRCEAFNKTSSLDGETNLKPKLALRNVNATLYSGLGSSSRLKLECHAPVADLYAFNGRVSYGDEQVDVDLK